MTTMVDRVAAALYEHQREAYPESATAKKQFYDDGIYHYAARIAIAAMRVPTASMTSEGIQWVGDGNSTEVWQAMIDAVEK